MASECRSTRNGALPPHPLSSLIHFFNAFFRIQNFIYFSINYLPISFCFFLLTLLEFPLAFVKEIMLYEKKNYLNEFCHI